MATTYGERLREALEAAKKSRAELAAVLRSPDGRVGISPSAIGQVIKGTSKAFSAENSAHAARFLGVNHYWLATGVGLMHDRSSVVPLTAAESPAPWLPSEDQVIRQLQSLLQRVEPDIRKGLADLLAAWVKDGGDEERIASICRLLAASEKQPVAARATGS